MHKISSRYLFFSFFPALLHCSLLLLVLNTLAQSLEKFIYIFIYIYKYNSTVNDDKTFSFFFLLSVSFNRKRRERSHQSINQSNQKGRVVGIRKKNIKIKITYTSQQTRHEQICVDE